MCRWLHAPLLMKLLMHLDRSIAETFDFSPSLHPYMSCTLLHVLYKTTDYTLISHGGDIKTCPLLLIDLADLFDSHPLVFFVCFISYFASRICFIL